MDALSRPAAPDAQPDPLLSFARVVLGDLEFGVDSRCVIRALRRPQRLARLPRSHGAIDGVFVHDGRTVPVVDLRAWMDTAATALAPPALVLVIGAGSRAIGLAIDAAAGVVRARQSAIQRIHQDEAEDGFFHSVVPAGADELLSLLDPLRLMVQAQAWAGMDADAAPAHDGTAAQGQSGMAPSRTAARTAARAVVRLGTSLLALPAGLVAQVLPRPALQPLFGTGLLGIIAWRGQPLPLVDLAGTLGVHADSAPLVMVLAQGDRLAALPLDGIEAMRTLPAKDVAAAQDAGITHPLVEGVALAEDGERILLLDGAYLLRTYAAPGLAAGAADGAAAGRAAPVPAHVVFDTGRRWAVPLHAIEEILPLPAAQCGDGAPPAGLPHTLPWRGRSLPLIDLRERPDGDGAPQRLLIAHHGGRHAALRVNDVVALLPAQQGELLPLPQAGGARGRMIMVGKGAARTSYPLLDLAALPFFAHAATAAA